MPTRPTPFVVAVDGPSGSGKSSTARGVATRLGLAYLDTGAMYRGVTWALLQRGVDTNDPAAVAAVVPQIQIVSGTDPQHPTITVDGVDVAVQIRGEDVVRHVSPVSTVPEVRTHLVDLQRATIAAADPGIVVEGRDIGTVVATDALLKLYLVADTRARAARRAAEEGGSDAAATAASLLSRDRIDSTRATSPLAKADDAVEVDSTSLSLEEVVDHIVTLVEERR